ncbi:hypothetical protein [Pseudomonas citronellolis]|uniref:hypothetical protein n=1 Tax=Pseudomonas citronellolis TaxID=53408 RepID=UPI0023E3E2DD|nr:hypothetical protein [Pseudomonas citronellolis]MDF3931364.1 hypothetical protein [Pseudomonas citronellolis]
MSARDLPASLLDNLRNATEFYKCVQAENKEGADCTSTGAWKDASEWLESAALQLGEALIAAHATGEVPHA